MGWVGLGRVGLGRAKPNPTLPYPTTRPQVYTLVQTNTFISRLNYTQKLKYNLKHYVANNKRSYSNKKQVKLTDNIAGVFIVVLSQVKVDPNASFFYYDSKCSRIENYLTYKGKSYYKEQLRRVIL